MTWGNNQTRRPNALDIGVTMSGTDRARSALERQQTDEWAAVPATQCECGTWRTPGITHARDNAGADPQYLTGGVCDK